MARAERTPLGVAAIVAFAAFAHPASAQTLQRLTITQFTLVSDAPAPALEMPFHLIVTVRVRERITALENVDLPILADLELRGDERHVTADKNGTTYREIIGVVAHHTGDIHIAAATVDAIDARDNHPKRYSSNDLTLHVSGGALVPAAAARTFLATLLRVVLWLAGIAAAIFAVIAVWTRRRREPVAQPAPLEVAAAPLERSPRDVLHDGLLTLRAERTRATAIAVRSLARRLIGASDRETLADSLRRPGAYDPRMREVLRTLERAAFTYDSDVPGAIDAAITSLEHATT